MLALSKALNGGDDKIIVNTSKTQGNKATGGSNGRTNQVNVRKATVRIPHPTNPHALRTAVIEVGSREYVPAKMSEEQFKKYKEIKE